MRLPFDRRTLEPPSRPPSRLGAPDVPMRCMRHDTVHGRVPTDEGHMLHISFGTPDMSKVEVEEEEKLVASELVLAEFPECALVNIHESGGTISLTGPLSDGVPLVSSGGFKFRGERDLSIGTLLYFEIPPAGGDAKLEGHSDRVLRFGIDAELPSHALVLSLKDEPNEAEAAAEKPK
eukprot:Polyplicarium_translucidae@DN915_c0_g1_i1.p1